MIQRTTGPVASREGMIESNRLFSPLPTEKDDLIVPHGVEIHQPAFQILDFDSLSLKGSDLVFEPAGEPTPLFFQASSELSIGIVGGVPLFAPESGQPV